MTCWLLTQVTPTKFLAAVLLLQIGEVKSYWVSVAILKVPQDLQQQQPDLLAGPHLVHDALHESSAARSLRADR